MYGVFCCKSLNSLNDKTPSLKYTFSVSAKRNNFFKSSPTLPPPSPRSQKKRKTAKRNSQSIKNTSIIDTENKNPVNDLFLWLLLEYQ